MTEFEIKQKAEATVLKLVTIENKLIEDATKGLTEEENMLFGKYFGACIGCLMETAEDKIKKAPEFDDMEQEVSFNDICDAFKELKNEVYTNDV